MFMIFLV